MHFLGVREIFFDLLDQNMDLYSATLSLGRDEHFPNSSLVILA